MIDKENMLGELEKFPSRCQEALQIAKKTRFKLKGKINKVFICGVGTSYAVAKIVSAFQKAIPIVPVRGFKLPALASKNSLIIILTYSAQTLPVQLLYKEARRKKLQIIVITSNEKLAQREKNAILLPKGILPRLAFPLLFISIVYILQKFKFIPAQQIKENISALDQRYCSKEGFMIAKKLKNKIPLIYASNSLFGLAYRLKEMINKNAKQGAFANALPDALHNEIEGLKKNPNRYAIVIIYDRDYNPNLKKAINVLHHILKRKINIVQIDMKGKNLFGKLLRTAYVCDYISYYLALMNKIDPTPTKLTSEAIEALAK